MLLKRNTKYRLLGWGESETLRLRLTSELPSSHLCLLSPEAHTAAPSFRLLFVLAIRYEHHGWTVVAHTFNPALRRQRQADLCELKVSLVYRANSRTTRAITQRNTVLKTK